MTEKYPVEPFPTIEQTDEGLIFINGEEFPFHVAYPGIEFSEQDGWTVASLPVIVDPGPTP